MNIDPVIEIDTEIDIENAPEDCGIEEAKQVDVGVTLHHPKVFDDAVHVLMTYHEM
jgi:hypothetical protein